MKDKIREICTELNDGKIAVVQATEQLFDLNSVSGSADANYWSERCKHAENIYENCPCDPDITYEQIESISGYHNFIKENGGKHYR